MRLLRQTDLVTAGTVMHGSKLGLTVLFWAVRLSATHANRRHNRHTAFRSLLGSAVALAPTT